MADFSDFSILLLGFTLVGRHDLRPVSRANEKDEYVEVKSEFGTSVESDGGAGIFTAIVDSCAGRRAPLFSA